MEYNNRTNKPGGEGKAGSMYFLNIPFPPKELHGEQKWQKFGFQQHFITYSRVSLYTWRERRWRRRMRRGQIYCHQKCNAYISPSCRDTHLAPFLPWATTIALRLPTCFLAEAVLTSFFTLLHWFNLWISATWSPHYHYTAAATAAKHTLLPTYLDTSECVPTFVCVVGSFIVCHPHTAIRSWLSLYPDFPLPSEEWQKCRRIIMYSSLAAYRGGAYLSYRWHISQHSLTHLPLMNVVWWRADGGGGGILLVVDSLSSKFLFSTTTTTRFLPTLSSM